MSAPSPYFFRTPIRYLRWASHEKPAIFYASCIASMGPVFLIAVPPLRRRFGDGPRERIPLTYPIPRGQRRIPEGYDDPQ